MVRIISTRFIGITSRRLPFDSPCSHCPPLGPLSLTQSMPSVV
jgi:hypothetical protein